MRNAIVTPLLTLMLVLIPANSASAAPQEDLTPPDVKLAKLTFKLNDLDYSIEAPEGATVKVEGATVFVNKGDDFGFMIEKGKWRLMYTSIWANADGKSVKDWVISKKNSFLAESVKPGERRFIAMITLPVSYTDFTIFSGYGDKPDQPLLTKANGLLVLKCAKTLTLTTPVPTEPAAILEWLKADVRKDDDGKVISVGMPESATDAAMPLLGKIPTLKSLTVRGASYADHHQGISDDGLAELEGMTNLEELGVNFDSISKEAIAHIGKVPNLTILSLGATAGTVVNFPERELVRLAGLANLQTLDLTNTPAGDAALECLKDIRSLKVLRLGSTQPTDRPDGPLRQPFSTLSDDGLSNLSKLANLETLSLRRTNITGTGFKHLKNCKKLVNLELNDTYVHDDGLEQIGAIESLQLLQLARTNVTGAGMKYLANLEDLKELDLTNTAVDDKGLGQLSILTHLESLQLRRTKITDDGMLHFETLKNLESLNLSETKITDAGLPHLYRLKKLQSLYTSDTAVTQDALEKLDKARESQ